MTSVMPKGVEHAAKLHGSLAGECVMTSVMPKGVEHVTLEMFVFCTFFVPVACRKV